MRFSDPEKLLVKVAAIFEELKIRYFVTGGFAVSVWGRPRATFDIDVVVELVEPQVDLLAKALRKLSIDGYIDEDTAREAIKQKGEFNFIDPESGLKVDFWIMKGDSLSRLEDARKIMKKINGQRIYFISPEDLILSKLRWYQDFKSSRHLEDIESVLKISGQKLDKQYLEKQAKRLGVTIILDKLMRSI